MAEMFRHAHPWYLKHPPTPEWIFAPDPAVLRGARGEVREEGLGLGHLLRGVLDVVRLVNGATPFTEPRETKMP